MKVLVIGSGAREHALCWKLKQSPLLTELFCAPGNPGTALLAHNLDLAADDLQGLAQAAVRHGIDFTIVGPELPLSAGIVDVFEERGLAIFGPSRLATRLESSKGFAKEVMASAGVLTAAYASFASESAALSYVAQAKLPLVVKADGLAAGKGVFICETMEHVRHALRQAFGQLRSDSVIIEEFLEGREVSFIVATDGSRVVPLASSHDYKRIFDGDRGPNTGGMGSVSPSPRLRDNQEQAVITGIIEPVLVEMRRRDQPFCGFLYAGLMITADEKIYVLEFNVRLGDPECQSIMRRMQSDLLQALLDLKRPDSRLPALRWSAESSVCVVLAAQGYPDTPALGDEVSGVDFAGMIDGCVVFHAGTKVKDSKLLTSGGRVLSVTALGPSLGESRVRAYKGCDMIQFRGQQVRRDIGL